MPLIPDLPTLVSITGTDPSSTDASVVHYTVTFSKPVSGVTVDQFTLATTGSINGAGITDITPVAGSNGASYTVTVNTGSGSGSLGLQLTGTNVHDSSGYYIGPFQSESQMAGPRFSIINTAAVGDVNGDGKQDMVYIRTVSASAYFLDVRTNDGTGQFKQTSLTGASELESSIRLGDVNGDGKLDVLMGNIFTGTLDVRLGNGDGTFAAATKYATGGSTGGNIRAFADFNGDGRADVIMSNNIGTSLLLGNGDGSFGSPIATNASNAFASGDFNGDGKIDLLVQDSSSSPVAVRLGNGDGTFQSPITAGTSSRTISGDFNGDGKLDLALGTNNSIAILLGNGDGTFASPQTFLTPAPIWNLAAADFNGDGKTDLAVVASSNNTLSTFYSRGDGTFGPAVTLPLASGANGITVGDLNGDGKADVVVEWTTSNSSTGEDVFLTAPNSTTTQYTISRTPPALTIVDADVTPGADGNNYINAAHFHGGMTTLSGSGNAGDTVTVTNAGDNSVVGVTTVGSDGSWSLGVSGLQDGSTYSYAATATDSLGNHSNPGPAFTFTVDATAPVLAITSIENSDATPFSITVRGTLDLADATSALTLSFGPTDHAVTSAADGTWRLDNLSPATGLSYVTARLRDAAGNTGVSQSIPLAFGYTLASGASLENAIVAAASSSFNPSLVVRGTSVGATVLRNGIEEDYGISTGSVVKNGGQQHVFGTGTTGAMIEAGGYQDIRAGGRATDTLLYGFGQVYANGTSAHTTIKAGGQQSVAAGGRDVNSTIDGGTQYLSGTATGTTVGAGGNQYDYGTANGVLVASGGSQHVYQGGRAAGTTVAAGGYQDVYQGTVTDTVLDGDQQVLGNGHAAGTVINAGGRQYVGSGGATTGTTIAAGGFQYVDAGATDGSATINGGYQFVAGAATATTVSGGGEQDVGAGGNVSNAHLDGGSEHVYAGGLLQNVDFGGSDGAALVLDTPAGLTGSIANFGADDTIDFRNTVVSSVDVDGANNLTVTTDGGQSYSWALLAQYSASSFVLASDGNGGTVLNYTPPQQMLLAAAH
ncbi:FG-GAP-like repeat-containing protein [Bradyrhizobium sp. 482_C4_N1_1]|uniref:beta strand repeat-containing protein n=1 Tax=Bradyrhizobium TaxID=374 RepID=UPI0024AF9B6E|nr:FG-GAP-like repeat-containing protein [Bradyrhizobium barranii]WFT94867.1 FG-GAP-like repeat-containing protein [Bradyrhizobium barranii]